MRDIHAMHDSLSELACLDHSRRPWCSGKTPPEKSFAFIPSLAAKKTVQAARRRPLRQNKWNDNFRLLMARKRRERHRRAPRRRASASCPRAINLATSDDASTSSLLTTLLSCARRKPVRTRSLSIVYTRCACIHLSGV